MIFYYFIIFSILSLFFFLFKEKIQSKDEMHKTCFLQQNLVTFLTDCCAALEIFEPVFLHSFVLRLFPGRMNVGNK